MNKMHTIQDVKQRIHELIQKEIAKCNKEIEEFEQKNKRQCNSIRRWRLVYTV